MSFTGPDVHRQNSITWLALSSVAFLVAILISSLMAIIVGFAALICGGVEMYRYRKTAKRRPKLKTRTKRRMRKVTKKATTGGRNLLRGKEHRASREYRPKRKVTSTRKPATGIEKPASRTCSARCQQSVKPVEACECFCGGKQHGRAAGHSASQRKPAPKRNSPPPKLKTPDEKFWVHRNSGYKGPIDHNGDRVHDIDAWIAKNRPKP